MTTRTIAKRVKVVPHPDGGTLTITATLDHIQGNTSPHFSVTAEHRDKSQGRRSDDYIIACGCLHEEVLKLAPEFAPAVALHLSDDTGIPMYAVENGWYWAGGTEWNGKRGYGPEIPNAKILSDHLRIPLVEAEKIVADVLAGSMTKEQFTGMVVRMQPRWYAEAKAVIEWLIEK